ncbi:MAG: hypothetical protein JO043_05210, partial [Candidatus Eremiobacteraeota bacterium]|nr:hypothetical protein [Candidatus Eremiobacteraeota bacterium]
MMLMRTLPFLAIGALPLWAPPVTARTIHAERLFPVTASAGASELSHAKERVLHSFQNGTDGDQPQPGLSADTAGALYGTTYDGGNSTGCFRSTPCGTVFKMIPSRNGYTKRTIYNFQNSGDGAYPNAGLIIDSTGVLYGNTGSNFNGPCCGVLFRLAPSKGGYTESVLYQFGSHDAVPNGNLVADSNLTFYGTSYQGGAHLQGAVIALAPTGSGYADNVLYSFAGGKDGANPVAGLLIGSGGVLYGTTMLGGGGPCNQGGGCGTVFSLTPSHGRYVERVLHRFQGGRDGQAPLGQLIADANGDLFGTTDSGGNGRHCAEGCGTAFELVPTGKAYRERILFDFRGAGQFPDARLTMDAAGDLFGTTQSGRDRVSNNGTVFELIPSGNGRYTPVTLHRFHGYPRDGAYVITSLLQDSAGALFGTTTLGGSGCPQVGCGTVFML